MTSLSEQAPAPAEHPTRVCPKHQLPLKAVGRYRALRCSRCAADYQQALRLRRDPARQQRNELRERKKLRIKTEQERHAEIIAATASLTETQKAYAAGLFDGEGTVTVALSRKRSTTDHRTGKSYPTSPQHTLTTSLTMTDQDIVQWLHATFGGSFNRRKGTNFPIWTWTASALKAVAFLRVVVPYLQVKLPQAKLAIEFQEGRVNQSGTLRGHRGIIVSASKINADELEKREAYRVAISNLNHKGAPFKCLQ